jgi:hypothetical protein
MNLSTIFGFGTGRNSSEDELPELFPLLVKETDFIKTDVMNIFSKILTDVAERTDGLKDEDSQLLFDNCLKSSSQEGLITMLAKAMFEKKDLFLIYDRAIKVIREATTLEMQEIRASYSVKAEPANIDGKRGVYISFRNFHISDMVKIYSALEYCTAGSLNKQMNLANSIQIKISKLRDSVSLADSAKAEEQALKIAKSLKSGKSTLLDAADSIETGDADAAPAKASSEYIARKLSFYLGLPAAYILGEQTGGLNSTGEIDQRAVERGLKKYYFSILKPAYEAIFEIKPKYKSQDFRQLTSGLETLKTFDISGDDYLTRDQKLRIEETEEEPVEIEVEETPPPELPQGE